MKIKLILLNALIVLVFTVNAQQKYKLAESTSKLIVEGTSSVHDWTMNSTDFSSTVQFEIENGILVKISDVNFSCPSKKIVSDNSIMNSKTQKALKSEDHPNIIFKFISIKSLTNQKNDFSGEITGTLSIAGKSKQIVFPFSGKVDPNGIIYVKGIVPIKMTDYNIEPPTAMMGALKTGDEVKINYSFQFVQSIN